MSAARKKKINRRRGEQWTLAELKQLGKVPNSILQGERI